jgi:hypothetical protein
MNKEMIQRHLGFPGEVSIMNRDGDTDKFVLSPLSVENIIDVYDIMNIINPVTMKQEITAEWLEKVSKLGLLSLKPNYPDMDDDTLKELVKRHALIFANEIWNINLGNMRSRETEKIKKIQDAIATGNTSKKQTEKV